MQERKEKREKKREEERAEGRRERVEWKIKIKREKEQRSLWKVWKTRKKRRDLDSFRSSFWLPFIFLMEFTVLVGLFPFSHLPHLGFQSIIPFYFFSLLPVLIKANDLTWTPWLLLFRLLSVPHKLTGRGTEAWKVDYDSASE